MARTPQALIALPPERADMLRAIAKVRHISIVDLIGEWIMRHVDEGVIPDETTGVGIAVVGRRIVLEIVADNSERMSVQKLGAHQARQLADMIEGTIKLGSDGGHHVTAGADEISIARIGTSVVFAQGGNRRKLAYSVARDVARQLRKASDTLKRSGR